MILNGEVYSISSTSSDHLSTGTTYVYDSYWLCCAVNHQPVKTTCLLGPLTCMILNGEVYSISLTSSNHLSTGTTNVYDSYRRWSVVNHRKVWLFYCRMQHTNADIDFLSTGSTGYYGTILNHKKHLLTWAMRVSLRM